MSLYIRNKICRTCFLPC